MSAPLTEREEIVRRALGETDATTYNGGVQDLDDRAREVVARLDAYERRGEVAARRRSTVYGALTSGPKPIRTLLGWRWLDAPEAETIAAIAVSALAERTSS